MMEPVLAGFSLLLLAIFVTVSCLPAWVGRLLFFAAAVFAALPWLGVPTETFRYPGADVPFPSLSWPNSFFCMYALLPLLDVLYSIGKVPLLFVEQLPIGGCEILWFASGGIRPFTYFVFWFGVCAASGVPAIGRAIREQRQRGQRSTRDADTRGRRRCCKSPFSGAEARRTSKGPDDGKRSSVA